MTDIGVRTPDKGLASFFMPAQRRAADSTTMRDRVEERVGSVLVPPQAPAPATGPSITLAPPVAPPVAPSARPTDVPTPDPRHAAPGTGAHARPLPELARLMTADVAAGAAAGLVAWELGIVAAALAVPAMAASGLLRRRFSPSALDDVPRLVRGCALVGAAFLLVCVTGAVSVTQVALGWLAYVVAAFLARTTAYSWIRAARRADEITYPVLLVGDDDGDIARRIEQHPETGLRLVGTVDASGLVTRTDGSSESVASFMSRGEVSDVIVHPVCAGPSTSSWVRRVAWREVALHLVVPEVGAAPHRGWDDHVWGVPVLRMQTALRWRRARLLKRLTDVVAASLSLLVLAPVLVVVAVAVRREVGRGILFRQERVGLEGRRFEVVKFRSMRNLPEGVVSPWSVTSSDRIGPVGRFIRHYSLDELPQLWNVLKGDMSLVGPRPERPEYVDRFSAEFPHYEFRHRVPVGLTGLAAVEGLRGNTSIHDRAYFDNLYVESWSYWADIKIIARTALAVAQGTGT